MNSVIETIRRRRSVRRFTDEPIPDDIVHALLEAANDAPSAHNKQAWRFVIVRGAAKERLTNLIRDESALLPRKMKILLRLSGQIIQSAPVVVAIFNTGELAHEIEGEHSREFREFFRLMEVQSSSAAVENLMIAATSLGIGTVWLGAVCLIKEKIARLLGQEAELMAVVPIGHPSREPSDGPRKKPLSEVTIF
jgi:nitroreductase